MCVFKIQDVKNDTLIPDSNTACNHDTHDNHDTCTRGVSKVREKKQVNKVII